MKAYGLPKYDDVAHPDKGDSKYYALKPSRFSFKNKSGKTRSNFKSCDDKQRVRRYFARKARINGKKECYIFEK